jgi:phosphoribosylformylglycinamidine cyclo-ligase
VLPANTRVMIEKRSWTPPAIFTLIQEMGNISEVDMYHTLNMGIGLVLLVDRIAAPGVVQRLNEAGESAAIIGEVQSGPQEVQIV